jgi:hypothetical protein
MFDFFDEVTGKAGNVDLPKLSMRTGYFEYVFGLTRTVKERLISYG